MYRGWTQTDYQNKQYNINQKDDGTWDDRGRDGGTNFTSRIKEQQTRLTLHEHDDDDDDDEVFKVWSVWKRRVQNSRLQNTFDSRYK